MNKKVLSILLLTVASIQAGKEEKKLLEMFGEVRKVGGRRIKKVRNGYVRKGNNEPPTVQTGGCVGYLDGSNQARNDLENVAEKSEITFDYNKLSIEAEKLKKQEELKRLLKEKPHAKVQKNDFRQGSRSGNSGESNRVLKAKFT